MKDIFKQFSIVLKYTAPFFLVLLPAIAIYGHVHPWQPSIQTLHKYGKSINILLGTDHHFSGNYKSQTRSYLVFFPNSLTSKTVFIEADSLGKYIVTEKDGGLLIVIMIYVVLILLTWWYWIKPKTHNE